MKTKFSIYKKYGSDTKKEIEGVPFYLDKETDCYIKVARWCNRNIEHSKEQADLTVEIKDLPTVDQETARMKVFAKHLITGWNNITDINGNIIEFTTENVITLLKQLPDLADELVGFSLTRDNYPLDNLEDVIKN